MSEKLDGMRAVWDGTALYSRAGNPISMPASFAACLPPAFALDGELFLGRGRFQVPKALPALISKGHPPQPVCPFRASAYYGPRQTSLAR